MSVQSWFVALSTLKAPVATSRTAVWIDAVSISPIFGLGPAGYWYAYALLSWSANWLYGASVHGSLDARDFRLGRIPTFRTISERAPLGLVTKCIHFAAASFTFEEFHITSGHPPRNPNSPLGPAGMGAIRIFLKSSGLAFLIALY